MAPPLIFLFFVIVVAAIVLGGALVAIRTGLWVRETDPHPDGAQAPDLEEAGSTAAGSRADTAYAEGRERAYGDEAATDERFSRPTADRSARGR
jgi:hypothetical protein